MNFPISKLAFLLNKCRNISPLLFHIFVAFIILLWQTNATSQINSNCRSVPDNIELPGDSTLCQKFDDFSSTPIIIGTGTNSVTLWSGTGLGFPLPFGIAQKDIIINGTLIIDEPAGFYACRIKLGDGATIKVISDIYMFSYLSRWFSCNTMWEGFVIQEDANLRSFNSEYEDAIHLITCDDGGILSLSSNTFNRNYICIRNGDSSPKFNGIHFEFLRSSLFTCTSELNTTQFGSKITHAGIYLDRGVATIGDYSSVNVFSYLENGIYATQSAASIVNLKFDNILETNIAESGCGINSHDSNIKVDAILQNNSWLGRSTFNNCQFVGIKSYRTNLDVQGAIFSGEMLGAFDVAQNQEAEFVSISHCVVDLNHPNNLLGMLINRGLGSGATPHYNLHHDTVYARDGAIGLLNHIGIGSQFPSTDRMIVEENYLVFNGTMGGAALFVGNILDPANNYELHHNEFIATSQSNSQFLRDAFYCRGNGSLNGSGHSFSHNTIQGFSSQGSLGGAIVLDGFANTKICDNTMDNTDVGILLFANNSPLKIQNSDIGRHETGLQILDGFVPGMNGLQNRFGNTWSSNASDYVFYAAECRSNPFFSRFNVENNNPGILPNPRTPAGPSWFRVTNGTVEQCMTFPEDMPQVLSIADSAIIMKTLFDTSWSDVMTWSAEKQLMLKLMRYPGLRPLGSDANTYFLNKSTTSPGNYATAELAYINAMLTTELILSIADSLNAIVSRNLDSLSSSYLKRLGVMDTTSLDSVFLLRITQWDDSIKQSMAEYTDQRFTIKVNQDQALVGVLSQVNNLNVNTSHESYYKTILLAKVERAINDSLSGARKTELIAISNNSVDVGGYAVPAAASLIWPCSNQYLTVRTDVVQNSAIEVTPQSQVLDNPLDSEADMQIYGNPAQEELRISWDRLVSGELHIFDYSGKKVQTFVVFESNEEFWQIALQPGAYVVSFVNVNGEINTKPLIVID